MKGLICTCSMLLMPQLARAWITSNGAARQRGWAKKQQHGHNIEMDRRAALITLTVSTVATTLVTFAQQPAFARAPGSNNLNDAVQQIRDAAEALQTLDANFDQYATIDAEGRAGDTNQARRILGGIAPQAGAAAIQVAQTTPLYRIDTALGVIRKASIEDEDDSTWPSQLDLATFEELVDRLTYSLQKADGDFYSVLFAAKGTTMIRAIFDEARGLIRQSIRDTNAIIQLLDAAGAPASRP